jgi:hypothetical protein
LLELVVQQARAVRVVHGAGVHKELQVLQSLVELFMQEVLSVITLERLSSTSIQQVQSRAHQALVALGQTVAPGTHLPLALQVLPEALG